jgi:hypothetical protein
MARLGGAWRGCGTAWLGLVGCGRDIFKKEVLMSDTKELLTTAMVAQHFGVTARRIRAKLARLHQLGIQVGFFTGTEWLFKPSELLLFKPGRRGRPRKYKQNR